MGDLVCQGAMCACSFGTTPSSLGVMPENQVLGCSKPAATIMDNKPNVNIMPFGMCSSMANPQVQSATAAALGVLTPMPCMPVIAAPWAPGSPTVMIGNKPALTASSTVMCAWAGSISITFPGQATVKLP